MVALIAIAVSNSLVTGIASPEEMQQSADISKMLIGILSLIGGQDIIKGWKTRNNNHGGP